MNQCTQASLPDGTKWLYRYDRLSQVTSVLSHLRTGKNGHCRASSGGRSVCIRSMRTSPPIQNLLRHCLLFARFHLRQHAGGERVDATTNAPVSGGSFRYAYDGIGNRTTSQEGSSANLLQYSTNNLNQYVSIFSPGVIPIRGRADADAKVAVTTTVGGTSTTYVPDRDGQDFSIDIPVDNSSGAVTAAVQVDALKHDGTLDLDLHRRLSGDYTVPAATPELPAYDADGNLLSYDGWTYVWNAEDRLVSATRGTTRLEFNYDYMGRRFEKKVYENNVLVKHQKFVYDGFKQIAEYDALNSNVLANTYLWQPVGLDVPLLRNGGEFYVSDANKNIVALIGTTGSITDSYLYDPFGNCTHTGFSTNPFRFSSEFFDEETELVYYNYRYYSPTLGRWLSRDPVGEGYGLNLYGICFNQMTNITDVNGLYSYIENKNGTDTITVGDCEIVIFDGHGSDKYPHVFLFPDNDKVCSAAGFTGCYTDITNGKIDPIHRLPQAPMSHDEVEVPSEEKNEQRKTLANSALKQSNLFCKRCCRRVSIYIHSNYGRGWKRIWEAKRDASYIFDCKTNIVRRTGGEKMFTAYDSLLHVRE